MADLTLKDIEQVLDKGLEHGFEKQAVLINNAFQEQKDHFDNLIADLKGDIQRVETKLDRALYTELTHLEARVKRLEQKTGIQSS